MSPSLVALYVATVRASALSRVERAGSGPGGGAGRGAVDSRACRRARRSSDVACAPGLAPDAARAPPRSLVSAVSGTQRARVCAQSLPERRETVITEHPV